MTNDTECKKFDKDKNIFILSIDDVRECENECFNKEDILAEIDKWNQIPNDLRKNIIFYKSYVTNLRM